MSTFSRLNKVSRRINLALIGPPGSGKGSYGRFLADYFQIPLVTVSDVLRSQKESNHQLHASLGQLVDDSVVSQAIFDHLVERQEREGYNRGYILDGFPRTLTQIDLMNSIWSTHLRIQAAVWLTVPDTVCQIKLLGRRICIKCGHHWNIASVNWNGWVVPANDDYRNKCPQIMLGEPCHPERDWTCRSDDTPELIPKRLRLYHEHMDPIVQHFQNQDSLFSFAPMKGFEDVPILQSSLKMWLKEKKLLEEDGQQGKN